MLPIVFSTTMNNMNWSIGLEVTLSVLGFTNINTPTIGVMIYWANQHTALVAGIWWWIFFPVLLVIMTFIGLFLLAVSMNEYIDPRSRLGRRETAMSRRPSLERLGPARLLPAPRRSASSARCARSTTSAFRSRRNEIYGLAGESSCGKTTLIKTIAAAIRPPLDVVAARSRSISADRRIDIHASAATSCATSAGGTCPTSCRAR